MIELELFPHCALPGCANLTDIQGHPCTECRTVFAELLRPAADAAPMTAGTMQRAWPTVRSA